MITRKVLLAVEKSGTSEIVISGGVSANSRLRERFAELSRETGFKVHFPLKKYTTDNAAMIAAEAFSMVRNGFSMTREELLALDANPVFA